MGKNAMRFWVMLLCACWLVVPAHAQDDALGVEDVTVETQTDVFGLEQQFATGTLLNESADTAYENITLLAEVYDDDDEIVGEGLGFVVNACGKNPPLEFVFQPEGELRFSVALELYDPDTEVERVEITAEAAAVDASTGDDFSPTDGVVPVTSREVVSVEWVLDGEATSEGLRFGSGCYRDVFTTFEWFRYDLEDDTISAIEHPRTADATSDITLERLDLQDPILYRRSFLSFPPGGRRLIHQTDINTLISAEPDGTFRRLIDEELFRSTLQGIYWLPEERFLAYYYGGFGDEVTYMVGSTAGAVLSTPQRFSIPSLTVPGVTPDASNVIISGAFNEDEITGFYIKPVAAEIFDLLFAYVNIPGNNYPAPVYKSRGGLQVEDVIYFALPDENDAPRLQCYDRREGELFDLAPLPLNLETEDRAYMWLSPDGEWIALGATGFNGGLWLLDLSAFDACYDG